MERLRRWVVVGAWSSLAILLVALLASSDETVLARRVFVDAGSYYNAGRAYLLGGDPYASLDFRQWPVVAALCSPFALVPPALGVRVFGLLSALGTIAGLLAVWRRASTEHGSLGQARMALTLVAPPSLVALYLGQMTGLVFAAYGLGLLLLNRRPWLAGLCFAAMGAKPHLLVLAAPALLGGPLAAAAAFAVGVLAWPLGSLAVGGVAGLGAFAHRLVEVRDHDAIVTVALASLAPSGSSGRASLQVALALILWAPLAIILVHRLVSGHRASERTLAAATAAALAGLPYAPLYELLFVLPAMLRVAARRDRAANAALALWWAVPVGATILLPHGGGALAAALPLVVAAALVRPGWARRRIDTATRPVRETAPIALVSVAATSREAAA